MYPRSNNASFKACVPPFASAFHRERRRVDTDVDPALIESHTALLRRVRVSRSHASAWLPDDMTPLVTAAPDKVLWSVQQFAVTWPRPSVVASLAANPRRLNRGCSRRIAVLPWDPRLPEDRPAPAAKAWEARLEPA